MIIGEDTNLDGFIEAVDDKVETFLEYTIEKYDFMGFLEPMVYSIRGGKKLRPTMTMLVHMSLGGDFESDSKWKMACAGELIHAASLVLDDIIDGDKTRRGKPSMSMVFRAGKSTLGAGAKWILAMMLGKDSNAPAALDLLTDLSGKIIRGNDREVAGVGLSMEEYMRVIHLKTGSLFSAAAELGAIENGDDMRAMLRAYGNDMGHAYQLTDDLVDVMISVKTKKLYRDMRIGRVSYPILLLNKSDEKFKPILRKFVDHKLTKDDATVLLEFLDEFDYESKTMEKIDYYKNRSVEHLPEGLEENCLRLLKKFPDYCVNSLLDKVKKVTGEED